MLKKTICSLICLAGLCTMASAGILPAWAGSENTGFAKWDTWTGFAIEQSINPDSSYYEVDSPDAMAYADAAYLTAYQGRNDVIQLSDHWQLDFWMPTEFAGNEIEVWVQVTYFDNGVTPLLGIENEPFTNLVYGPYAITSEDHGDGWVTGAWNFNILDQTDWQLITINFDDYDAYVDQVSIDTIVIPEPLTLSLLALGALPLIRKRRNA